MRPVCRGSILQRLDKSSYFTSLESPAPIKKLVILLFRDSYLQVAYLLDTRKL